MKTWREPRMQPGKLRSGVGLLPDLLRSLDDGGTGLADISQMARLRRGQVVTTGSQLGFLLEGRLAVMGPRRRRPDAILSLIGPGEMFGHPFQDHGEGQTVALLPGRAFQVDRHAFERLIAAQPLAEWMLLGRLIEEVETARDWAVLMGNHKVVERVAAYFLLLCRRQLALDPGARTPLRIRIEIPRTDLARHLCARVESLSRAFHQLQQQGVLEIVQPNAFDIRDLGRLALIGNQDLPSDAVRDMALPRR